MEIKSAIKSFIYNDQMLYLPFKFHLPSDSNTQFVSSSPPGQSGYESHLADIGSTGVPPKHEKVSEMSVSCFVTTISKGSQSIQGPFRNILDN